MVAVRELIEVSPLYKLNCWETWGNKPRVDKLLVKTILCGHGSSTYKTVERSLPKSKTSTLVQVILIQGHLPTSRKSPWNKVHCRPSHNSQPSRYFLKYLFGSKKRKASLKKWDPQVSKNRVFHFLAFLILCLRTVDLDAVDIYKNGKILLKQPKIKMAIMRNVPIRQDCSFKKCT